MRLKITKNGTLIPAETILALAGWVADQLPPVTGELRIIARYHKGTTPHGHITGKQFTGGRTATIMLPAPGAECLPCPISYRARNGCTSDHCELRDAHDGIIWIFALIFAFATKRNQQKKGTLRHLHAYNTAAAALVHSQVPTERATIVQSIESAITKKAEQESRSTTPQPPTIEEIRGKLLKAQARWTRKQKLATTKLVKIERQLKRLDRSVEAQKAAPDGSGN